MFRRIVVAVDLEQDEPQDRLLKAASDMALTETIAAKLDGRQR